MTQLKLAKLTHANTLKPVTIVLNQLAFFYTSDASKSTYIMSSGGAIIPVLETPDVIENLLKDNNISKEKGELNVRN